MPRNVLIVGPPPERIGGMSAVVRQMTGLRLGGEHHVSLLPFTISDSPSEGMLSKWIRHARQTRRLVQAIRENSASIVHLHTCSGATFWRTCLDLRAARWMGCRVVVHVHGAAFDAFHDSCSRASRALIRRSITLADRVIALSNGWADALRRIAPLARIRVLENAVDAPPPQSTRRHAGPCRFLFLARLDTWKGVDDLLRASQILRREETPFELTVAGPPGSAGDASEIARRADELGLSDSCRCIGAVEGSEKGRLLEWADVFVLPSHHEGMPIALLEALVRGLCVIAADVGAVGEIIEQDREGLLFQPRDVSSLADAMRELANDAPRRLRMGDAGREIARRRFSLSRLESELTEVYDELGVEKRRFRAVTAPLLRDGAA